MKSELLNEKQRIAREGLVIREITNVQVRIPACCLDGGIIVNSNGSTEPCPHVVKMRRAKKGNVGM